MQPVAPAIPLLAAMTAIGLVLLCGAVVHADIARRRIPNSLCAVIALLAVIHGLGDGGWSGLMEFALRLASVAAIGLPLVLLFITRALGGGDVKLAMALLLWIPVPQMPLMLAVTVVSGAAIAIGLKGLGRLFCFVRSDTVPYGLAIVFGALWVLLPRFDRLAGVACGLVA